MGARRKPFWTLDSESDPFHSCINPACTKCENPGPLSRGRVPQPFIWGLYGGPNGDDYHEFEKPSEVVAFLENQPHLVYAHNGGKFDYHYLRDFINTDEPLSIIAGRLSRFKIGECEFRDSFNILPVSLATFKKDDFDYSILEPDVRHEPANREKIRKYLRSDCLYLYELVTAHRAENGVALTQAGASMRAWSKQSKIQPPKQSAARYQQYKPYYYGGRVQCFASGVASKAFQVIDINSAYPFAMLSEHPFSTAGVHQKNLPADGLIHKCLITLTCTARGCFPLRSGDDPTKGDLFFPHDEHTIRRYHITGYEFLAALRHDAIKNVSIEDVHYFGDGVKFEEFISQNWSRRAQAKREGNKALEIIIKLLMNSLYGKFASDYAKYREYYLCHRDDILRYVSAESFAAEWRRSHCNGLPTEFVSDTDWGNGRFLVSRHIPEEKHRFYNIATAASITGYVRAMLFEALSQCGDPLYCDTDSIACESTGNLRLGEGLGAWKVEGNFDRYAIAGKKMYAFHKTGKPEEDTYDNHRSEYLNWKVACKGVDLSPVEIFDVASGRKIKYLPQTPTYSVKRDQPKFIGRNVKLTAKDIRHVN